MRCCVATPNRAERSATSIVRHLVTHSCKLWLKPVFQYTPTLKGIIVES